VQDRLIAAFTLVGQVYTVHQLVNADSSYVELTDPQKEAVEVVVHSLERVLKNDGVSALQDPSQISSFADTFASFVSGSSSEVAAGVNFAELRTLIQNSLTDSALLAKTNQRIANKQLAERAEEAERQKAAQKAAVQVEAAKEEETKDAPAETQQHV
jgi:hypothetical protein